MVVPDCIGFLFSAAEIACKVPTECCEDIPDVYEKTTTALMAMVSYRKDSLSFLSRI